MGTLLDLPGELLIEIFQYLDPRDVLRCTAVCARLCDVVKNSLELQYNIELAADGLVDGVRSPLSISERLTRLLELRARWRSLDWTGVTSVSMKGYCDAYDMADGVIACLMTSPSRSIQYLVLCWLPTNTSPGRTIEMDDLDFEAEDIVLDPTQDLVVLLSIELQEHENTASLSLHLRTMSENKIHPRASRPVLEATIYNADTPDHLSVQVVDDLVGLIFRLRGAYISIWNWRTGEQIVCCSGDDLPANTWDFCFLSSRAFLLSSCSDDGMIALCTFDEEPNRLLPTVVAELHFPPTMKGIELREVRIESGPLVSSYLAERQICTDRDARIVAIPFRYNVYREHYIIYVPHRYLVSLLQRPLSRESRCITMKWEEWGLDNSRMLNRQLSLETKGYIHGSRVILPTTHPTRLVVGDFNVHPKRTNDPVEMGTSHIIDEGATIESDIFQHPVVTRLPYVELTKSRLAVLREYAELWVDGERVIGIKTGHTGNVNMDVYTL